MRSKRQAVATHGNGFACFGRSWPIRICDRLPAFATTGLHKGFILCSQSRQQSVADLLSWTPLTGWRRRSERRFSSCVTEAFDPLFENLVEALVSGLVSV